MGGYFGTPCARRDERTPDPELNAPIPQTAVCRCTETAFLVAGRLPHGWRIVDDEVLCADCVQGTNIVVDLAAFREILRNRDAQAIGGLPSSDQPHHGCRVSHDILCGFAALEFRGGAQPPHGRDEAVPFMLNEHELDQLIIHLSTVRAELMASQIPGAAAREGGLNG